jgi:hypothetical protein
MTSSADDERDAGSWPRRYQPPAEGTADQRAGRLYDSPPDPSLEGRAPYVEGWPPPRSSAPVPAAAVSAGVPQPLQVREGGLAAVARIVGIIRDLVIIALVVGVLTIGGRALAAFQDARGADQPVTPATAPCVAPETDEYGTYCPEESPGD